MPKSGGLILELIYSLIAVALLIIHWGDRNAVWGGATLGIIVGLILALVQGNWAVLALSFSIGTFVGTIFEWIGRLSYKLRR